MANQTTPRLTVRKGDHTLNELPDFPLAAGAALLGGLMVALDANGNLVDGGDGAAVKVIGICDESVSNVGGIAGAKRAAVRRGSHWMDAATASPPTQAAAYLTNLKASDNHSVTLNAGTGVAISGRLLTVTERGVLVEFY
jgi:hypothetical protein